jgi:hypothetical protein
MATPTFTTKSLNGEVLANPTSLQWGPDGRLYVAQQNGVIKAFTVEKDQAGEWSVVQTETIDLVHQIANHNDDGLLNASVTGRQITGIVVTEEAGNIVIYAGSSDPRIGGGGSGADKDLDTNSGIISRLEQTFGPEGVGTWDKVDLVRGLPRSEENHSVNGLQLSTDGSTLYVSVGGFTNAGSPSNNFAWSPEYALSAAVLSVDLAALKSMDVQGSGNDQYVYDLPTLDDPTVANGGSREDANGMDVNGPFGGNDGLNMAVLDAAAPISIHSTGYRNAYDLVLTQNGQLYTIDNGPNSGWGGEPVDANGSPTSQPGAGEATNKPNTNTATGYGDSLYLTGSGGYYGHANPTRSNQNGPVYAADGRGAILVVQDIDDINGNGDRTEMIALTDLSMLVPDVLNIPDGYLIDPSKFTHVAGRLTQEGILIPASAGDAMTVIGASTNGMAEYTANTFDGAMQGDLIAVSFNGNVYWLKLDDATGTVFEGQEILANLPQTPLDVTVKADGTIWVARIGGSDIMILEPAENASAIDTDIDKDGILNKDDPFPHDQQNGNATVILGGETYTWDFDLLGEHPGPAGWTLGLTGMLPNGTNDFFNELDFDNVKVSGVQGRLVIESVSEGDAYKAENAGEFLFSTGMKFAQNVDTFTVNWTLLNPFPFLATVPEDWQQAGGFIGVDQDNYLKIVATKNGGSEFEVLLETNGNPVSYKFNSDALFSAPQQSQIFLSLQVDIAAATVTPIISYESAPGGALITVTGLSAISIANTQILDAILGNYTVLDQDGVAHTAQLGVGLWSTNNNANGTQPEMAVEWLDMSVTTTVKPGPYAPDAVSDSFTALAGPIEIAALGGEGTAGLLDNDTDLDPGDVLKVTAVGDALHGTVVLDDKGTEQPEDDTVTFTPDHGFYGVASFTYTVTDSFGLTDTATAFINVLPSVLFRVNVGGPALAATDNGPDWAADTTAANNPNLVDPGSNKTATFPGGSIAESVPVTTPATVFDTERWDGAGGTEMSWAFATPDDGWYEVRLYFKDGYAGTNGAGLRVFDVNIEGQTAVDDLDLSAQFGHQTAVMLSYAVNVSDGELNIDFIHGVENPLVNAIEIVAIDAPPPPPPSDDIILYRVNAGGLEVAAVDGGPAWAADTTTVVNAHLVQPGSNSTAAFAGGVADASVPDTTAMGIFATERWDAAGGNEMAWQFDVPTAGDYEVRLYFKSGWSGTDLAGERIFDVLMEGQTIIDDLDLSGQYGHQTAVMISSIVFVSDGALNVDFAHFVENPLINGIEIIQLENSATTTTQLSLKLGGEQAFGEGPAFQVYADGTMIGEGQVAGIDGLFDPENEENWEVFNFDIAGAPPDEIEIRYINDTDDPATGDDRNLWVDYIVLDDAIHEGEVDGTFTSPTGEFDGSREDMQVNGSMVFDLTQDALVV